MDPIACVERGSVDCKYAGRLVAGMLDDKVHRVDYMDVVDFFNYSGCLGPTDNVGSIMLSYDQWTMTANKDDIQLLTEGIISVSGCKIDFCRNLEFSGNSDFAGIGVLVSFCIQISVATLFGLFCLYRLFVVGSSRTTWHSFRGTFHTFFVSSVYINVALCLAVTITVAFEDRTEHTAIFASLGFLLSLASTQALWALYRLYIRSSTKDLGETTEKPTILTETLLIRLCLGCLWVALLVLCAYIIKVGWDSNFETFCFHELGARPFARRLLYAPIGIASIGLILAVLRQIFPGEANSRRWGWVYPTMAFLGFILMWLAFGALWFLRTQLGTIAGDTYQDDQWGFGQVIAVAAWLPSLVDIVREVFRVVRSCRSDPGTHPTEELELGSGLGQR